MSKGFYWFLMYFLCINHEFDIMIKFKKMSMFGFQNCDFGCESLMRWTWKFQNEIIRLKFDECWFNIGSLRVFLRKPQVHLELCIAMAIWYLCKRAIRRRREAITTGYCKEHAMENKQINKTFPWFQPMIHVKEV